MRAYRLAYDGRPFHGFQRQPDVPTVEGVLFEALRDLDVFAADASNPPNYAAAGRTDAGVSARAQTVAFAAPRWLTPAALNGTLPATVRAWAHADVPDGFHATHDASSRAYRYFLFAPTAGETGDAVPADGQEFDARRFRTAVERLTGDHDFHNLTPDDNGTIRDLSATVERDGEVFVIELRAGGFARQLVRRVIGLATDIGRGNTPLDHIDRVFSPAALDGPAGVAPAPAEPLVLWDVAYDDVAFDVDETAATNARATFDQRHREWRTAARVAGAIRDGID